MADSGRRQLLTIGVFFIIIVVAILLNPLGVVKNWWNVLQLIIVLFGVWMLVLAALRGSKHSKVRALTIQHRSNGRASNGRRRCMVRVGLQLDLHGSRAASCARSHSHRFSHATKQASLEPALSPFSALNIFLPLCAVTMAEGSML